MGHPVSGAISASSTLMVQTLFAGKACFNVRARRHFVEFSSAGPRPRCGNELRIDTSGGNRAPSKLIGHCAGTDKARQRYDQTIASPAYNNRQNFFPLALGRNRMSKSLDAIISGNEYDYGLDVARCQSICCPPRNFLFRLARLERLHELADDFRRVLAEQAI